MTSSREPWMSPCPNCGSLHPDSNCPLLEATALDPKDDPLLGEVLGEVYRIEWRLSVGGMGKVYRALHLPTGTMVAMKVLFTTFDSGDRDEVIRRFEREGEATRK